MKYSAVAIAAFVAAASAQADISIIPSCAIPCIDEATAQSSTCDAKDYKCICSNVEAIVPAATTCVLAECGNAVALNEVLPATETFCKEVLAGGDDTASTTAAPESSAPATSSAPPETSSEEGSSSEVPETSSVVPSVYPTASITSSAVPSAEPSSTTTSTTSVITAGAASVAGSLGLLVLGAVAAL